MRWISAVSFLAMLSVGCSDSKDGETTGGEIEDTGSTGDDTGDADVDADADADDTGSSNVDEDGDGFDETVDCDDQNPDINPGAAESCDGVDNNCDGLIDEGFPSAAEYYPDEDGDGYGDDADVVVSCEPIDGLITQGGDCDDTNAEVNPLGIELCDGIDNNCDGEVDGDTAVDKDFFFLDADGDGYGITEGFIQACELPEGYADNDTDCDDENGEVYPGAVEICDELDNNCDDVTDPPESEDASTWYRDADSDTYGNADVTETSCWGSEGFVADDSDCDDTDPTVNPDGTETCDGEDENCDGTVDEGFDTETYYRDYDGDEFGDPADSIVYCERPAGYVIDSTDCDDDNYWRNPGLPELCDGIDNDCDETVDEEIEDVTYYPDADGDLYGDASGEPVVDCAPPSGYVVDSTDCDDSDATVNPGEIEACNGVDDNCDGELDEGLELVTFFLDEDDDGYGIPEETTEACAVPDGYSELDTDCDDEVPSTKPGAYEFCDGVDNDCDDVVDDDCGSSVILGAYESAVCEDTSGNLEQEGDRMRVNWNPNGTWCNTSGYGFEIGDGEDGYYESVTPGSSWQEFTAEWSAGSATFKHTGNYAYSTSFTYDTSCAGTLGDDETVAGAIHEFIMDDLTVTKTEIWEVEGLVSRVWFDVVNEGSDDVTDFRLMWASDWDQDRSDPSVTSTFNTINDVNDDGDFDDVDGGMMAISEGPGSGRTVIMGSCDGETQSLGYSSPWDRDIDDALSDMVDYDGSSVDAAAHWIASGLEVAVDESLSFGFLVVVGEDADEAVEAYVEQAPILCTE